MKDAHSSSLRACLERKNFTGIAQESVHFYRKTTRIGKKIAFQTGHYW
jgi:hypothetical protein